MKNIASKLTITQDSLSGISQKVVAQVQNSTESISSCAPNVRSISGISVSTPTTSSTSTYSTYKSTGTVSSCAPKNNK